MAASGKRFSTEEVLDFFKDEDSENEGSPILEETFSAYVGVVVESEEENERDEELQSLAEDDGSDTEVQSESEDGVDTCAVATSDMETLSSDAETQKSSQSDLAEKALRSCAAAHSSIDPYELSDTSESSQAIESSAESSSSDDDDIDAVHQTEYTGGSQAHDIERNNVSTILCFP